MAVEGEIEVEVAYALPGEQRLLKVRGQAGMTLRQAVEKSGVLERHSEIDLSVNRTGVFGKVTEPDTPLTSGDRVEIYRPLIADPKEVRRKRAGRKRGEI